MNNELLLLRYMPLVTHYALVTCTVLMNSLDESHDEDAAVMKVGWIEVLEGLELDPGLEMYFASASDNSVTVPPPPPPPCLNLLEDTD